MARDEASVMSELTTIVNEPNPIRPSKDYEAFAKSMIWNNYDNNRFDDVVNFLDSMLNDAWPAHKKVAIFGLTSSKGNPILHQAILDANLSLVNDLLDVLVNANIPFDALMIFLQSRNGLSLFEKAFRSSSTAMTNGLVDKFETLPYSQAEKLKLLFSDTDFPTCIQPLFKDDDKKNHQAFRLQFRELVYSKLSSAKKTKIIQSFESEYQLFSKQKRNPQFISTYEYFIKDGFIDLSDKLTLLQQYKSEKEAALMLVVDNPKVLTYLTPSLLEDKPFMRLCLNQNALCLKFDKSGLKSDVNACKKAIKQNPKAKKYIAEHLKLQPSFQSKKSVKNTEFFKVKAISQNQDDAKAKKDKGLMFKNA